MNLNKVFILGNLTRNPETRALPSGQNVASFGVATNRFYTNSSGEKKQEAEFHNVVAFGKLADIVSRYLVKGSLILAEGRLKTRSWQDSSGAKRSRTEVIAQNIQMAPKSMGPMGRTMAPTEPAGETAKEEDIPVIEEDYIPPSPTQSNFKGNPQTPEPEPDEIDVKDIPF